MLLQALVEQAGFRSGDVPRGYAVKPVRWTLDLDANGKLRSPTLGKLSDADKPARGLSMAIPETVRSGVKPAPFLCVDTLEYALGIPKDDSPKAARDAEAKNAAFIDLLRHEVQSAPSIAPLLKFFEIGETPEIPPDAKPIDRVAVTIDGQWLHDRPDVRATWPRVVSWRKASGVVGVCLVCGGVASLAGTFQSMIPIGSVPDQGKTMALVSVNKSAQGRGGATGLVNTPVCEDCAAASMGTLVEMLGNEMHRRRLNAVGATFVWWLREGNQFNPFEVLENSNVNEVRSLLERFSKSGELQLLAEDRFQGVILRANAARAVVSSWIDRSMADVVGALQQWHADSAIVDPWDGEVVPPLWKLAKATGRWKKDRKIYDDKNVHNSEDALIMCALAGSRPPVSLVSTILARIRSDHHVSSERVSLIRLVLIRNQLAPLEVLMPGLNTQAIDAPYVCGRLLAMLNNLQRAALGDVNATLADRVLGRASMAPAAVLAGALRDSNAHIKKLRTQGKGGLSVYWQRRIDEVVELLEGFPNALNVSEQARFVLGFHHQRAADMPRKTESTERSNEETN